jgi:hypothetical protein
MAQAQTKKRSTKKTLKKRAHLPAPYAYTVTHVPVKESPKLAKAKEILRDLGEL